MLPDPSHKGVVLILGGGPPPHSMGGEEPDQGDAPMIPVPKDFDMGDSQPGDTLTVQMECRVAPDGKHLIPLSVDGKGMDGDDDQDDPSPDDDGPSPSDKWQEMFGKR